MSFVGDIDLVGSLVQDDGVQAFAIAAALCGCPIEAQELQRRFNMSGDFGPAAMIRAAQTLGLKSRLVRPKSTRPRGVSLPAIGRDHDGRHFMLARTALDATGAVGKLLLQYPGERPEALDRVAFLQRWAGSFILLGRRHPLGDTDRPFGLPWFLDAVERPRKSVGPTRRADHRGAGVGALSSPRRSG